MRPSSRVTSPAGSAGRNVESAANGEFIAIVEVRTEVLVVLDRIVAEPCTETSSTTDDMDGVERDMGDLK